MAAAAARSGAAAVAGRRKATAAVAGGAGGEVWSLSLPTPFIFISWPSEPRLICRTAQGVLLREAAVSGTSDPTPTILGLYSTVNRAFISHHSYCAV